MKKLLTGGIAAALAVAGIVAGAPASSAVANVPAPYKLVGQCPGSLVDTYTPANTLGDTQGSLKLYYSSANGGTNCVMLFDNAPGSHSMTVTLRRSDLNYQGSDSGVFETYAGGVLVPSTNGRCVFVSGVLWMGTHSVDRFSVSKGPVHCG